MLKKWKAETALIFRVIRNLLIVTVSLQVGVIVASLAHHGLDVSAILSEPQFFLASISPGQSGTETVKAVESITSAVTTPAPASQTSLDLPSWIELLAVFAGAIAGASRGCIEDLDFIGVAVLATVTALGGGLIRDVILPTNSIYILEAPIALILCLIVSIMVFFFSQLFEGPLRIPMTVADIASVGLFAGVGAEKALITGIDPIPCVLLGSIAAVGGGAARDICLVSTPSIFKQSNYYAIAGIAGAAVYVVFVELHLVKGIAFVACVLTTVALRLLSLHFNWRTAGPRDLTPHLMRALRQLSRNDDAVVIKASSSETALDVSALAESDAKNHKDVVVLVLDDYAPTTQEIAEAEKLDALYNQVESLRDKRTDEINERTEADKPSD